MNVKRVHPWYPSVVCDSDSKHNLKVREHTILGPYVDGLSTLAVSSFEVSEWKSRLVAELTNGLWSHAKTMSVWPTLLAKVAC